jgi:hypothetical protein
MILHRQDHTPMWQVGVGVDERDGTELAGMNV